MNTRGFWGFNVWIEPFAITMENERLGIFQTNIIQKLLGLDLSHLSNGILIYLKKVPVLRRMVELASLGWFGMFVFTRMIIQRRYRILLTLLPLILLWLALIASTPTFFEPRYMFTYHLALPVLGYLSMSRPSKNEN